MARAESPDLRRDELSEMVAGRYRLTRLLARGGMGEVFVAEDQSTGRRVALKRLLPAALRQRTLVAHFMREYHALSELRHPRIIEVYDYGVDHDVPYYTMELLDGADLRDLAPLPYREACSYLRDVASSLALLHARRLLHRDVSPRNVRRTSNGRCKLIDFGAMIPFGIPPNVSGTPPCIPPEALQGGPLDQRSDLFALGALAYSVLTGRHGYSVGELEELPAAWKLPLIRPKRRVRDIPDALDELVMGLMSLDPMKRPASAAEVIDWLSAIGELEADDTAAAARSFLTSSNLWGRDAERVELTKRLGKTLVGQGSALLICGEPGTGKSRLLAESALIGQTCGLTVVRAIARKQRGASSPLVSDLVLGLRQAAPLEAQRASARRPYVLAELTGGDTRSTGRIATESGEFRGQLLEQITGYCREIARERPVLITVDDLDRADEFSSAVVAALADSTKYSALSLIAAHGSHDSNTSVLANVQGLAAIWTLVPLTRSQSHQLVSSLFGDVPNSDRVSDWLYRVAHGNPKLTLELAEHLLARGIVRYVEGTWVLPSEIDEPLPQNLSEALMLRLRNVSPAARGLAEIVSVRRGGTPADGLLEIAQQPAPLVFGALEELVRAGVLESAGQDYVFGQDALRRALVRSLDPARSRELHTRWAERLLAQLPTTLDTQLEAGWHLIHTERELQGADLLAKVGPELVERRVSLATAVPAIERALIAYERHARPLSTILKLRALLVMSAYLFDYRLADRYANDTLDALYRFTGLAEGQRYSRIFGKTLGFALGQLRALLRWSFNWTLKRGPRPVRASVYYTRAAMGLLGVRASAMDVAGTRAALDRMQGFDQTPVPTLRTVYSIGKALAFQGQGRESESYTAIQEALKGLRRRPAFMSAAEHTDMLVGALLVYGINESYREHSRALECAQRLERLGTPLALVAAQRVSMTYYIVRGNRERTQHCRRQLDLAAIQGGSSWQVEWFAVPIEGLAAAMWTDLIALRRSLDRLERMVVKVPSLVFMLEALRLPYHFRRGDFAEAAAIGEAFVARHPPRTLIGWASTYAVTALAYIEIGEPERALLLCERALTHVSEEDRSYFVMYSGLEAAYATALAVLGQRERAEEIFRVRLARLRACGEHVRAFTLHEYRAKIARMLGDRPGLLAAVRDMREAALASGNPAVIALADRVTELRARQRSSPLPPSREIAEAPAPIVIEPPTMDETAVTRFLRDVHEPEVRAQHALVMLGQYGGGGEAYLYWVAGKELQLAASLDERLPPAPLEAYLAGRLDAGNRDPDRMIELADVGRYRILELYANEFEGECVGIAALREAETKLGDVPVSLVAEIGRVLRDHHRLSSFPPPQHAGSG